VSQAQTSEASSRSIFADAVRAWDRFWFQPVSPTLLGLIRICVGFLALYVHLAYTVDLQEFFGEHAWVGRSDIDDFRHNQPVMAPIATWEDPTFTIPRTPEEIQYRLKWGMPSEMAYDHGYINWSIWYHVSNPRAMAVVHGLVLLSLFCFAIGFCTPVTSVLSWLGIASYLHRSPTTLFGMDTMMNLLVLYLVVGQSGAALSVDRLFIRYWRASRAIRLKKQPVDDVPPRVSANLALRLIQINLCCIYLVSGISKLQGGAWWRLNAVWGTLANPEFSPLYFPPFYALLSWLCRHRLLWEAAISSASLFTLVLEIGFPFLVWRPRCRPVMICMAVMLHAGIACFMSLNTFSLMMVFMVLSFVDPQAIDRWLNRLAGRQKHLALEFNSRSDRQSRAASLVHAVDVWNQVELTDLPQAEESSQADSDQLTLVTDGKELRGYSIFVSLARALTLLRPLILVTWLPGFASMARSRYPEASRPHTSAPGKRQSKQPAQEKVSR
jgi:hypothetical protein